MPNKSNFPGRPYAQSNIDQLEALVDKATVDEAIKATLLNELKYRKTRRAQVLTKCLENIAGQIQPIDEKVESGKAAIATPPHALEILHIIPDASDVAFDISSLHRQSEHPNPIPIPARAIANNPQDILRSWTALEVLSPATFRKPTDLAGGDMRRIARFDRGVPWANGTAKGPPNHRLYFQIVLGSIIMQPSIDRLLTRFSDLRPERPNARGETPLAIVIVDREGRPIPDNCAVVSSFGWGLPVALAQDPAMLSAWQDEEARVQCELHAQLYREGADGKPQPLTMSMINSAANWLKDRFGLDGALLRPPAFAVRSTVPFRQSEPPEPLLLNSFFLKDLRVASRLFSEGKAPDALRRFVGALAPEERRDLLDDEAAIEEVVAPSLFPLGRWPGPGRHPLVLMQQAAVNLAIAQNSGEILAVNGPPGTGKTTLLRDAVAALVTQRASALTAFDDPETAFSHTGQKLNLGGAWIHLYRLDPRIKGFEMLIASSNNKAVENVSRELPGIGAIADDATDLRYFKPLSDGFLGGESWGAIAAVLGNASNRHAFKNQFWWTPDTGLFSYLKAIDGRQTDVKDDDGTERRPRIVSELQPPRDHREALRRWQDARKRYRALERKAQDNRSGAEQFRQRCRSLSELEILLNALGAHGLSRPGFWHRLFRLKRYREWKAEHVSVLAKFSTQAKLAEQGKAIPATLATQLKRSPWFGFRPDEHMELNRIALGEIIEIHQQNIKARAGVAVDDALFDQGIWASQTAAPWYTTDEHSTRDALFTAALDLHRAFIDAAAKPLRHNLAAALQILDGKGFADATKDALIPDLWSSLFLVVPAMSTTFASVGTMLANMPQESLGWLLIDEAGQASPQQAVGAIMRTQRAIIVGDPIQVPPVVMLPDRLTAAICGALGVGADVFAAPSASVQTLADNATAWFAEFPARVGSRTVGVPLRVHRRCSEPMFSIANAVAYEGLMVQAKLSKPSLIRDVLGTSRWIDVVGSGTDKYCEAEGLEAVALLIQIVSAGLDPDIYIVTPFVQVAEGLRRLIRENTQLRGCINDLDGWVYERVGTIHTVQGREAEAVIFVLGAPNADQNGARVWGGKQPNLLNVAVTRAKEAIYVIGNRTHWQSAGFFKELSEYLPASP